MKHTDAIKLIMKDKNVTLQHIATELGLNSIGAIGTLLKRDTGRVARIISILDILGYELAARPKTEEHWPDEYVLTIQDYRESD